MIINAGYRFELTTWENDADNYRTETVDGLSFEMAQFYVDLAKLHASQHNQQNPGFGNMYEPDEEEEKEYLEALTALLHKHYAALDKKYNLNDPEHPFDVNDESHVSDFIGDICYSIGLQGGEFYTRVTDDYKVQYVPETIKIEDVTDTFV